jgi:hypothetical protein
MAALGNMQEILIDAYFDDLLDDEEFGNTTHFI